MLKDATAEKDALVLRREMVKAWESRDGTLTAEKKNLEKEIADLRESEKARMATEVRMKEALEAKE